MGAVRVMHVGERPRREQTRGGRATNPARRVGVRAGCWVARWHTSGWCTAGRPPQVVCCGAGL